MRHSKVCSTMVLTRLLGDVISLGTAMTLAYIVASILSNVLYERTYIPINSSYLVTSILMFTGFSVLALLIWHGNGHYTERLPWWHQVRQIILVLLAIIVIQGFVHYFMKFPLSRMWVGLTWTLAIPIILISRLFVRAALKKAGKWSLRTIVVGGEDVVLETLYALHSDRYADYDVQEIVLIRSGSTRPDLDAAELPERYKNAKISFGLTAARQLVLPEAFFVLVPNENRSAEGVEELIKIFQQSHVPYALVPPVMRFSVYGAAPRYFFGHNLVMFTPPRMGRPLFERLGKRALDISGSIFGLILLSPVFLLIAYLIKKQNPASHVFFGHKRVGKDHIEFPCYKFTSMVPNAKEVLEELLAKSPEAREEWERDFKLKNDPRVTKIGHLLRRTSLDELPQLWNVLRGDMSLVGPRPVVDKELAYYGDDASFYLSQKPGITGLWQVSGRNDTTYAYRVYLDKWYALHGSLWHDIVILFETVGILVSRKGAY